MVAERWETDEGESHVVDEGSALWERLYERIAHRFGRVEVRARLKRYLVGLLGRIDRKNGWQIAEAIGEDGPQGVQRLLNSAVWDAEAVRDDLRAYVLEHPGDPETGVLLVDESGFPKKGNASCGVASQYCGTTGSTTNCQVGVFLGYASRHGMAFLDRALYLTRIWAVIALAESCAAGMGRWLLVRRPESDPTGIVSGTRRDSGNGSSTQSGPLGRRTQP